MVTEVTPDTYCFFRKDQVNVISETISPDLSRPTLLAVTVTPCPVAIASSIAARIRGPSSQVNVILDVAFLMYLACDSTIKVENLPRPAVATCINAPVDSSAAPFCAAK